MSYDLSQYMRGVKTRVDEAIQSVVDNIASNHGLDENAQIKCYGEIQAELIKDWQAPTPKPVQMYRLDYPKKLNVDLGYRMTYINIKGSSVVDSHMYGDTTVIVMYEKRTINREAIDEILRHLRANGESIKFEPKNLRSVRLGRTKFNHLIGNDGFIFAMGLKMYARLYRQIQDDAGLKPRFVP